MYGKLLPNDSFVQFQGIGEFPTDSFEDELQMRVAFGRTWTADKPFGRAWTPISKARRASSRAAPTRMGPRAAVPSTLNTRQHVWPAPECAYR